MLLAFYNGRNFGTWLDRLIAGHERGRDAGPFSHVELVLEHAPRRASLCFSSSWRDGGVRLKRIGLEETADKWTLVPLAIDARSGRAVRHWCMRHLGGRYDIPGVLAFKLPLVRQRMNWWFCSEICVAALQQAGLLGDVKPHRISPNALYLLAQASFNQAPQSVTIAHV